MTCSRAFLRVLGRPTGFHTCEESVERRDDLLLMHLHKYDFQARRGPGTRKGREGPRLAHGKGPRLAHAGLQAYLVRRSR